MDKIQYLIIIIFLTLFYYKSFFKDNCWININYTMEKTTVEFLKEYAIHYKKILYGILITIGLIIGLNLYTKYTYINFNNQFNTINKAINNEGKDQDKLQNINGFFKKNNGWFISPKKIFILNWTYFSLIITLKKIMIKNKKYLNFIEKGQWKILIEQIKNNNDEFNQINIINSLITLEKIYQYVKNNNPYSCVLNGKNINYQGEQLNFIIFYHILNRENSMVAKNFFHYNCLHISIFSGYTKILYVKFLEPNNSPNIVSSENSDTNAIVKKFINW